MLSKEVLQIVKRIEIRTNRLVNEALGGEYHSVFKGRGMEFDEVREYQYGDDIRTIDWNVSARLGHFYELESLSSAKALRPGQSIEHTQRTIHVEGDEPSLDRIARAVLGVSLEQIAKELPGSEPHARK